jgi:hypothetical protein
VIATKDGFKLFTDNLTPILKALLPVDLTLLISFKSPTPEGHLYFGRNHPFVEQLCQIMLANAVLRHSPRAARASVIRTQDVKTKTTLLLFRCRNVIGERRGVNKIIAEEMLIWGYRGTPSDHDFLTSIEAKALLDSARASANLTPEARAQALSNELQFLPTEHGTVANVDEFQNRQAAILKTEFDKVAEERSQHLVEAHERFSQFMDARQYQVVYPVLPMDILGIYVLLPDSNSKGQAL